MKAIRLIVLLGLVLIFFVQKYATTNDSPSTSSSTWTQSSSPSAAGVPDKALHVLQIVRDTGQPPDGYVGGRVFQNREGRLPSDGDYREFDVDPHRGGRNAERIIVEWNTKKAWYTGDHYQTFIPLP